MGNFHPQEMIPSQWYPIGFMGRMVYLPIHGWLIFMVNVVKYSSPMDPMGTG